MIPESEASSRMDTPTCFQDWMKWLAAFPAQSGPAIHPGIEGDILDYGASKGFLLGMALQTQQGRVRFYGRTKNGFSVVERPFHGDRVEGPLHRHGYLELGYVVHGCARQTFSNREYRFSAGDFWITDYQCHHRDLYFPEDLFTLWIGMPQDLFNAVFLDSVGPSPVQRFLHTALLRQKERRQFLHFTPRKETESASAIMEVLTAELHQQQIGMESIVRGLTARLLSSLSLSYDCLLEEQEKLHMHLLLYNEVETYIRSHLDTVTIGALTSRFHYNGDFYNRLLRRYGGTTYSALLQRLRLEEAKSLLVHSDLSVEEILPRVGYQSKGFFYRLFQQHVGMTPGAFRTQARTPPQRQGSAPPGHP